MKTIVAVLFIIALAFAMICGCSNKPRASWVYDPAGKTFFAHLQSEEIPVSDKDLQKNSGALLGKTYLYRFAIYEYVDLKEYLRLHPNDDARRYQDKYVIVSDDLPDRRFFEYDEYIRIKGSCGFQEVQLSCEKID